jgi:hypothetical protein
MKYYIALNPENKILSAIFVCGKQEFVELTLSEINKKRCVFYSEKELQRIKFPPKTKFQQIDSKQYGGCKYISKLEEEEEAEKMKIVIKEILPTNSIEFQSKLKNK